MCFDLYLLLAARLRIWRGWLFTTRRLGLAWLAGLGLIAACAPEVVKISTRNPDLFEKSTDHLVGQSRGHDESDPPSVYVRQSKTVIKDRGPASTSGSLFNPDDERNYLFTPTGPLNVGRFLKVRILANKNLGKDGDTSGESAASRRGAAKAAGKREGGDAKDGKPEEVEAELLKALPDLAPADKGHPMLVGSFKMQIMHRYANGDVLATAVRESKTGDHHHQVQVQARLPYDRLASGDDLTTDDLLDVHITETHGEEVAERSSAAWEDEYSLRLSGFSEAKSRVAQDLADQRQKLTDATAKLEGRIKSFAEERRQIVKQREDLSHKKQESDQKVDDLESKVKDQAAVIEKQQEELQSLSPEDKPTDGKEGGRGKGKA